MSETLLRARDRRLRFMQQLGSGAVLIAGSSTCRRNADSDYSFRQDSDFHYLTAFPEPDSLCVLFPAEARMVLFVPPRDVKAETWTGRRAGVEGAQEIYGADEAFSNEEMVARLPQLLSEIDTLHYAMGSRADVDTCVQALIQQHRRQRPRQAKGILRVEDPTSVLHEMRLLKEPFEIDRMRQAVQATDAGHLRILRDCRAGMFEYELQAMLEYEFRRRGAGPAYGSIVGGGLNATILHYVQNDCALNAGELVLVDAGAEFELYAADVTRTFPVEGSFSPPQRDLYELVLEAQRRAIDAVRPGAAFSDGHDAAVHCLCEGLVDLKLAQGSAEELLESRDYRSFYMHRTGHWLGLDVHDAGSYRQNDASRVLQPGMVLTVEPGLYIGEDRDDVPAAFRGIGIRIEDDVLVTNEGHEVLTACIPKSVTEIESLRGASALR